MPKVIHTSLREARTLDREDSVSSLWIWNSGNHADTILTSDDDDSKWQYNQSMSPSNQRLSIERSSLVLSRTPSSHSSSESKKLRLSVESQQLLAFSQSPSPVPSKLSVSASAETLKSSLLVSPTAATTKKNKLSFQDMDVRQTPPASKDGNSRSKHSYNSDDYGSVGEFSLPEEEDIGEEKQSSSYSLKKPPPPPSYEEEEPTERESDSFTSPAMSISKYVKRIGTSPHSSATSSLLLQASDSDVMQPRVMEDDDMDSYISEGEEQDIQDTEHIREVLLVDEDIKDTGHQREVPVLDEDIKDTEHQRTSPGTVPVSEAAMRQKKIDTELNGMIEEMMQSDDFYEEEDMEPESYLALMRAAKEICYTRKYFDVSADKIIYFPSISKTIVHNDLFEKAEEYYFEEGDEFPMDYIMALRSIALDRMVADEENAGSQHNDELDDDTMHRISIRVQRTETDQDELQALIEAAEAEDAHAEKEESAHSVALQAADKEEQRPNVAESQDQNTMWWEVAADTEDKYKQRERLSVVILGAKAPPQVSEEVDPTVEEEVVDVRKPTAVEMTEKPPQVSEQDPVEEEELNVPKPTVVDKADKPKVSRASWWNIGPNSKYEISDDDDDEELLEASESDNDSEASDKESEVEQSEMPLENEDDGDVVPQPAASETGNGDKDGNDIFKWLRGGKSKQSDGPSRVTNRISLLLPTKKAPEPILMEREDEESAPKLMKVHEQSEVTDKEESDPPTFEHETQEIEATSKESNSEILEAAPAGSVDGVSQETPQSARSTEDVSGYKVEQMTPKTRRRNKKITSVSTASTPLEEEQSAMKTDEAAVKAIPESMPDQETKGMEEAENDQRLETVVAAEDETIDDDSSDTASFDVKNIVVVSKHDREDEGNHNHDSAISSLHANAYGDENDATSRGAMASLQSLIMTSTESEQTDNEEVVHGNLSSVVNSTSSETKIQVLPNSDGVSGTWSLGGTYENASKEDMVGLLKTIQEDITMLIKNVENGGDRSQTRDNSTTGSEASASNAFSLVLRPGVQKTLSGITLTSTNVPNKGGNKAKSTTRKKRKSASSESGWIKVAMKSPERSERTAVRSNKARGTPLTNLSNVTEESMVPEGEDKITWTFTNKEGRKPASPRSGKRTTRKGRRKSTGSHDEAYDFYDLQEAFKESSDGASPRGRSIPRSQPSSKIEQSKSFSSAGSSKASRKSMPKKKRSKSSSGSQKRSSSPKPRRSASVECGTVPPKLSSPKRVSKKSLKEPLGFESSNAGQSSFPRKHSSAKVRRRSTSVENLKDRRNPTFTKVRRSSSVSALIDPPQPKSKKEKKPPSKRFSTGLEMVENLNPFARKSTGDSENRKEKIREKKETSLRNLSRKLDKTIGIQQSPPVEGKKKNPLDLPAKTKEVEGLREKLRMSFAKVIKSS
ncbi:unnamed protein product [Cylindrotheca closterium]|uniref:Uncharacterized protein n=1 Tax=Cylindrotheca closterium TaxID=2856 RepID=A0AAD2CEI9_9STRA|nr:unnamed protein product [Cylindrotheca closterium]